MTTASDGLVVHGFWCERYVYRSHEADSVASWASVVTDSPVFAVLHIVADAEEMAAGLPEAEQQRVIGTLDATERADAMVALHLGVPCGLALSCGATWVEWTAQPVRFLRLAVRSGPTCAGRSGRRDGFGAPMVAADGDG
ncbi:hypothetical protein [Streptomyces pinistramenti]|uniref:hypothetical protein n=1 Tax=Streptomyces pinistramenti TaxID=2884812 RepID=UPI001D099A96|nr:hypothetical protein [Streptomyces pinistramenti]MCB5908636.1 hypothetical protein [Streptomyces pinistramenti]